jgi:predicted transcriptional regulator YdeE
MIVLVTMPELTVVGLVVRAHWNDLARVIPDAWNRVFARADEISGAAEVVGPWLEVSISGENGFYTEMVGALVDSCQSPPAGMQVMTIPASRYLTLTHGGPLAGIADGFGALYD